MQTKPPTYLHPEEEPFGACLELEHIDPPAGALRHTLELTVIREDDQILQERKVRVSIPETRTTEAHNLPGKHAGACICVWGGEGRIQTR